MDEFLKKIGLQEEIKAEIIISPEEFKKQFHRHVMEDRGNFFPDIWNAFSSEEREFRGHLNSSHFSIRRTKKMFENNSLMAKAKCTYTQNGDVLVIDAQIKSPVVFVSVLGVLLLFVYVFFLSAHFNSDTANENLFLPTFLVFHACLMLGISYFMMRRSVYTLKHDLEREFHFWATKR